MPARLTRLLLLLALFGAVAPGPVRAADAPPADRVAKEAHVTFQTSTSVYVDAGADDGIAVGDMLEVVRDGIFFAHLKVTFTSSHKSSCTKIPPEAGIAVNDTVRYTAPKPPPKPAPGTAAAAKAAGRPRDGMRALGLRGRVGLTYIFVEQVSGAGSRYSRPGLDLRLDGDRIAGSGFGLNVDLRAYRSYRKAGAGATRTDSSNRLYRASASWIAPKVPVRLTLGRQFSPSMATVSIFDGALVEYDGPRFSAGVMAGTQPDPATYGYSGDTREYGAYVEYRNAPDATSRWAVTGGLIGSYVLGAVNREFLYAQGRYDTKRVSIYLTQEVDYYHGWKRREAGESSVSPTSTYVSARVRVTDWFDLNAGYDNRRNVRLVRDEITPLTEFDDAFRRGFWAGADMRFGEHFRAGIDGRISGGGTGGSADSYSLYLSGSRLTAIHFDVRSRTTRYSNERIAGWLEAVTFSVPIIDRIHVGVTAGMRNDSSKVITQEDVRLRWWGLDLDIVMGRHWFFILSGENTTGSDEDNRQVYSSIAYRF